MWRLNGFNNGQNLLFRFLQNKTTVAINIFYKKNKILGKIIGFDEFMNLVVDEAEEVSSDEKRVKIGRVLIRGDSIMFVHESYCWEWKKEMKKSMYVLNNWK